MSELQKHIASQCSCSTSIAWIQRQSRSALKLKDMYPKALAAVGGKFSQGLNSIIAYRDQDQSTVIFPRELADSMLTHMRQGNLPGALSRVGKLAERLRGGTYQDFKQHIRLLCYHILVYLKDRDVPEIRKLVQQVRTHPESLETLERFRAVFQDILESIHRHTDVPGRKQLAHFQAILGYLSKQFQDPACCVQSIADHLDLSPNYVRQIYKDGSGQSLSDALVALRIKEACRLLTEFAKPVKEIYSLAGFTNYNSFFTSFKKSTGKTPAEYRRNL